MRCRSTAGTPGGRCAGSARNSRPATTPSHTRTWIRCSGQITGTAGPQVPRQPDLLRLVAAGHTNTQIARRLGITEGTVRTHLENIYERLHVSSRAAAVTRAFADSVA